MPFTLSGLISLLGGLAFSASRNEDFKLTGNQIDLAVSEGSGMKLLSDFIIEPVIIVSEDLREIDKKELGNLIKYHVELFTAYYLQIIHVTMGVYDVEPKIAFSLASSGGVKAGQVYDMIGGHEKFLVNPTDETIVGTEAPGDRELTKLSIDRDDKFERGFDKQATVVITVDDREISMPIYVRPKIIFSNVENIVQVSDRGDGTSFSDAIFEFKAGTRSFMDVLLGTSLIEAYKDKKIRNPNELTELLQDRRAKANTKMLGGSIGFNLYYAMMIMNVENRSYIESLFGKLDKDRNKERFLEETKCMSLSLVDLSYEDMEVFLLNTRGSSTTTLKALVKDKKNGDNDELIKLLVANKSIF